MKASELRPGQLRNINDIVEVTLTDVALKILDDQKAATADLCCVPHKTITERKYRCELWQLMADFGGIIGHGSQLFVDNEIRLVDDEPSTLWCVGKTIDAETSSWEMQGVFNSEQKAIEACVLTSMFVGPIVLNASFSVESCEWAGSYYPSERDCERPAPSTPEPFKAGDWVVCDLAEYGLGSEPHVIDAVKRDSLFIAGQGYHQSRFRHATAAEIEAVEPKPLQIAEGKYYERRDGEIVGPAENTNEYHSQRWQVGVWFYPDNGRFIHDRREDHSYDLIREVPPPVKREAEADGWIEWHGGDCPVDGETRVDVRFMDGALGGPLEAKHWWWGRKPTANYKIHITHYRVVPLEPKKPIKGPSKAWLREMAEKEDGECVSVGGLAVELGLYKKPATEDMHPVHFRDGIWYWGDWLLEHKAYAIKRGERYLQSNSEHGSGFTDCIRQTWTPSQMASIHVSLLTGCEPVCISEQVPFELPEPPAPKQYRPFASAEEFKPHCWRVLRSTCVANHYLIPGWFNDYGCARDGMTYAELLGQFVFDDNGEPCGIEVQ
jgi:hypothetical protein